MVPGKEAKYKTAKLKNLSIKLGSKIILFELRHFKHFSIKTISSFVSQLDFNSWKFRFGLKVQISSAAFRLSHCINKLSI